MKNITVRELVLMIISLMVLLWLAFGGIEVIQHLFRVG